MWQETLNELGWMDGRRMRSHGDSQLPPVIVLHGGPAAAGSAKSLAEGLSDTHCAFEPWQRGSGEEPLTVARHIEDLDALVEYIGAPVPIIGESWGAMLALAYAAAHPTRVSRVAAIACGTFDLAARAEFERLRAERIDQEAMSALLTSGKSGAELMTDKFKLTLAAYDFDAEPAEELDCDEPFDERAHGETWADVLRLQNAGVYPASFAKITCPVAMFHGDYDPHPGEMIRYSLTPHIPHLEYFNYAEAGHSLQRERRVKETFFVELSEWLHT